MESSNGALRVRDSGSEFVERKSETGRKPQKAKLNHTYVDLAPARSLHLLALYGELGKERAPFFEPHQKRFDMQLEAALTADLELELRKAEKWLSSFGLRSAVRPILSDTVQFVVTLLPTVFGSIAFALSVCAVYFYSRGDIGIVIVAVLSAGAFLAFTAIAINVRSVVRKRMRRDFGWSTPQLHGSYSGFLSRALSYIQAR